MMIKSLFSDFMPWMLGAGFALGFAIGVAIAIWTLAARGLL